MKFRYYNQIKYNFLIKIINIMSWYILLPGKSHGRRSLVGYGPWGRWVGHNWAISLSLFTFMHWRKKWQPTPVFLPGESQGRGRLVGCCLWGHTVGHNRSDLAAAAAWTEGSLVGTISLDSISCLNSCKFTYHKVCPFKVHFRMDTKSCMNHCYLIPEYFNHL